VSRAGRSRNVNHAVAAYGARPAPMADHRVQKKYQRMQIDMAILSTKPYDSGRNRSIFPSGLRAEERR
jgi:hypothetical protein